MGRRKVEKHLDCIAYLSVCGSLNEIERKERNQEKVIREYAKSHNIKIVKVIRRNGSSLDRVNKQLDEIAVMIRKHQVDGMILTRAKALSDDEEYVYRAVGKIKAAKGAFVTVDEGRLGMNLKEVAYAVQKKPYKKYRKGDVVYADLGNQPRGVQGGMRPCIVVSCDASNHCWAPQVTVCPLSSKLKDKIVHVKILPSDVEGYHLRTESDVLAEDIVTIAKDMIRGRLGRIDVNSELMKKIDRAMMIHLGIIKPSVNRKINNTNM